MTNSQSHAQVELDILSKSVPDAIILEFKDEILALCEKFGKSGQSGGSAPYTASALSSAIKKLCMFETIAPLAGIDDEWNDVTEHSPGETLYQNRRSAAVFKDDKGAWYLDAIVWCGDTPGESGNTWDTFSGTVQGIKSRQYIKEFPFEPKTFYINATREMLPADCRTCHPSCVGSSRRTKQANLRRRLFVHRQVPIAAAASRNRSTWPVRLQ